MGRPAKYRNVAEKQKAYRERQKSDQKQSEALQALVSELEYREQSLRNQFAYHARKGKPCRVHLERSGDWASIEVNGNFTNTINALIVHYLAASGKLVLIDENWRGKFYDLSG